MIHVGVVGYGCWGPNLARCVASNQAFALSAICDASPERLTSAALAFPEADLETDTELLINDSGIDAVVLATPAVTHYPLARAALRAGKHVLVEKPIVLASEDALRLIEEAERRRLVLMVDHTYLFSPPVRAIRKFVNTGALGPIHSFESVRVNRNGAYRDVNVLWDLASHDLSILDYIFEREPCAIGAVTSAPGPDDAVCRADLSVHLSGGLIAEIHVDRSGPDKIRRILIAGTEKTLVFDDLEASAKIRIHDTWPRSERTSVGAGEASLLPFEEGEPLKAVVDHFAASILTGRRPLSDGETGLRVVRLLEAAGRSMADSGRLVSLTADAVIQT